MAMGHEQEYESDQSAEIGTECSDRKRKGFVRGGYAACGKDQLHFYLEETSEAEKMQEYCIKITKTGKNDANEVEVVRSKAKFIKN
jgi:hypothetical protein